jgi:hypothetical protein
MKVRFTEKYECEVLAGEIVDLPIELVDNEREKELLWEFVSQCWDEQEKHYDSMANSSYTQAIRDLAAMGELKITADVGRRVIAVKVTTEENDK